MKGITKVLALAVLLFTGMFAKAANPTYTLAEALKKKLIKAEIKGADSASPSSGGHYGKCLQIKLTNLTTQKFNVQITAGQQLEPDDSTIQTMMVTEGELFAFNTLKTQKKYINAMCIQKNDGGPGRQVVFKTGVMSTGNLLGIAQLVEKHKYFDGVGQAAVWCISDRQPISSIYCDDTVKLKILQEFVSKATGQVIPPRGHQPDDQPQQPRRGFKTTVTFEWTASKAYKTTLVVLDMNNKPMMEILKDQTLQQGFHKYSFELSTSELPEGEYKVLLYLDNKIFMQRKVKLGRD